MSLLHKDEIKKLAQISALKLDTEEVDLLTAQVEKILNYVTQISNANVSEQPSIRLSKFNIFREDNVSQFDSTPLLEQAPKNNNHYFVVPQILEQNK